MPNGAEAASTSSLPPAEINGAPHGGRKPAKEMTKAERRAVQEQQRQAKAKEKAAKGTSSGKPPAASTSGSKSKPGTSAGPSAAPGIPGKGQTKQTTVLPVAIESLSLSTSASPLSLFLHLDPPRSARTLSSKLQKEQIHQSVLRLALQYAEFRIVGANARCIAMLEAFKDVISSYVVPPGKSLARHLPSHLSAQITHIVRARPMAVSMGNAIRYLKWEIAQVPLDMEEEEAKELLCERIDHFIRDRIVLAGKVIESHAIGKIREGDTVLTFARSSLVEGVLLAAKKQGKMFSVVVVDSRPMHEGKNLLRSLLAAEIPCSYVLLPSIGSVLPTVSLTLLGTHALLSNGAMYSRAGTAMVAMMCKGAGIPVICCCETYKFSDRIMLDSIVGNELASTAGILPSGLPENPNLGVLNFLYDVSRPEDVTAVVTDAGIVPVQSAPVVIREHKPIVLGN